MFVDIQLSLCQYLSNKNDLYEEQHEAEDDEEDFPTPGSAHLSRKKVNNCCCYSLQTWKLTCLHTLAGDWVLRETFLGQKA